MSARGIWQRGVAKATNQLVQDVATYPVPDGALLCPARYADLLATVAEAAATGAIDPDAWSALRLMYRTAYESRTRRCTCARCSRARTASALRLERIRAEHHAAAAHALRRRIHHGPAVGAPMPPAADPPPGPCPSVSVRVRPCPSVVVRVRPCPPEGLPDA